MISMEKSHNYMCRVFIEDTDLGGVVYHANYLKMAERARSMMFLDAGIDLATVIAEYGLFFVVTRCVVDFKAPARLGDQLHIETSIIEKTRVKIVFCQVIKGQSNKIIAELKVTVAVVDKTFMIRKFPEQFGLYDTIKCRDEKHG